MHLDDHIPFFQPYVPYTLNPGQPYLPYASPPDQTIYLLPWWMRGDDWIDYAPFHRGWFAGAFPNLHPYFPMASVSPVWVDPWSTQPYHSYWWG